MEAFAVLVIIVLSVVVQTVGRMRGAPNVPVFFWVALLLSTIAPLVTGWMVLNKGEVLQSASVQKSKDHVQVDIPDGYALLVTGQLNPEDSDKEDAYKTSYTLRVAGDKWKEKVSGEVTKQNQGKQQLKAIQGETISESGKKQTNRTGQHLQDRFVLTGSGPVDVFVENYSGDAAVSLLLEVTQAPPKALWLWGFAVFSSLLGIYFQAWKKCDQVAGDLAGLPFYAVFLADGITPTASWFNVGTAFLPGMFLGWGVVAGLAWLATKYVDSSQKNKA
jgi:hypothetical protein